MSSRGRGVAVRARWLAGPLAALVLLAAPGRAATEDALASLSGTWRGAVTENGLDARLSEVEAVLDVGERDVAARWSTLDSRTAEAELVPTARPDVLTQPVRGLQAMLGGNRPPNPLEGGPLLWGRRDGHGFYVYRLEIGQDGALMLDRYGFEPAPGGAVTFTASRAGPQGGELGRLRATLTRQAP